MYPRVLALFSDASYSPPVIGEISEDGYQMPIDLTPHLTNTSLQKSAREKGVLLLDELAGCRVLSLPQTLGNDPSTMLQLTVNDIAVIKDQMANVLSETFKAALEMPVHFQVGIPR
jgi:tubulin---tyrosine ligase